jgi:hypothetical protein
MKFPAKLNPLRGTQFAWLIPFTWAVVKCAAIATPTTIEVFLHHRFGSRSGKALLKGFLLLLIVSTMLMHSDPQSVFPLFPGYLFAYIICALGHWLTSQGRAAEQIYSYSSGEPWPSLWQQIPLETATIRRFLEPALCGLIACVALLFDSAVAHWLFIAAIALFIKEQVLCAQLRARHLDAYDNRAESERLAPRARAENEHFVEARPALPPRRPERPPL